MGNIISGGITAVPCIKAAAVSCGIKGDKKDLAVVYSEVPLVSAAVFTTNLVKAAPVLVSQRNIKEKVTRAVVVNSGNANACSGLRGLKDAERMAALTAEYLKLCPGEILVSSTGVIGQFLPMEKVEKGIKMAVENLTEEGGSDSAEAILTTDTVKKEIAYRFMLAGKTVTLGAMAKGSGMICPNMATMLAFITTDVKISKELLQKALQESVKCSYNLITVDGDTSTNDMVLLLANGQAENPEITEEGEDYQAFLEALNYVNKAMARQIILDGEGTTKLIEVTLQGFKDYDTGRKLVMGILNSNLVKTAFFGEDANWGRIITAMGYSSSNFCPEKVDIFLGDLQVMKEGVGLIFDEASAKEILSHKEVKVFIDLKEGKDKITAWGSDLSHQYVTINSSYRT
ncbi:bifunctional glutamate N-acetyltransferase/amino-acid acetyltransferase ArgJ [Candidatus Contubernalis alkaliaceticus]|uniref:bifunctional glutamate N-acetyltransferase/amino-acid acetyltransferase ArgJ n=1 Tax=Candidatus Contubernalis alkaliaceticus TaxID=338645 RepID=UPI001F4C2563|nr:bifunctional glutamate N-acetyltransferase/amino-acid acetyltransferase ArgJ [Candidatus Contubernalis alkalaceticus]UNC91486.1 bifunctional glutamate N-acetyltransferase/amino-acid acetyltransferase ArgJ [Candidatus Contubernalis alkalaceticus]